MSELNLQDRRVLKTKKALQEAFFALVKENSISKITVKALVERADVNRSTFYDYYPDFETFIDELENEIWDDIHVGLRVDIAARQLELARIYDRRDTFKLLAGVHGDVLFMAKLRQLIQKNWREMAILSKLTIPEKYAVAAIAGLFTEVLGTWIRDDFQESPDEMGKILATLVEGLPERLFHLKTDI